MRLVLKLSVFWCVRVFGIDNKGSWTPSLSSFLLFSLALLHLQVCLCVLVLFFPVSTACVGLAQPSMALRCVCECVCKRDRQGGSVGDLAGQGRGRGQIGETKVTLTVRVFLSTPARPAVQLMMAPLYRLHHSVIVF